MAAAGKPDDDEQEEEQEDEGGEEEDEDVREKKDWCCYLLVTADMTNTYFGATVNFPRRLKQHNGLIGQDKRGAKRTRLKRPAHGLWQPVLIITGFDEETRRARKFESWYHDQQRGRPRWTPDHKRLPLHVKNMKIDPVACSFVIRRAVTLLHALIVLLPNQRYRHWPLVFTFHVPRAMPMNFFEMFPSTCSARLASHLTIDDNATTARQSTMVAVIPAST